MNFLEPGAWAKVILPLRVRSVIPWVPVIPRRRARSLESIRSASGHWRLHLLLEAARNQAGVDLKRWIGGTVRRRASAVDAAERIVRYLTSGRRLFRKTNSRLNFVLRRWWLDNLIQSLLHLNSVLLFSSLSKNSSGAVIGRGQSLRSHWAHSNNSQFCTCFMSIGSTEASVELLENVLEFWKRAWFCNPLPLVLWFVLKTTVRFLQRN